MHFPPTWILRLLIVAAFAALQIAARRRRSAPRPVSQRPVELAGFSEPSTGGEPIETTGAATISSKPLTPK
jgi:hypothetical protein